jgi:Nif-specific regulatory protein
MADTRERSGMRSKYEELSLLFEISQILDQSLDLNQVIQPVLRTAAERLDFVRVAITLLNRNTGEIFIEAAHGLSRTQQQRGRYRLGEGVTGRVVQSGRPEIIPLISEDPSFLNRTGARNARGSREISFICVPIKLGNETIGALSVDMPATDQDELEEAVRVLSILASLIAQAVKLRQTVMEEKRALVEENTRLQEELRERFRPSNIIGSSRAMQDVFDLIAQVSRSDATVLIRGESGTGKELVAHAIHYNSRRADKPFVKVNCAALPETIIESELFGHEKGAFTGATQNRKGRFELANGGTIFLDEIGDLSPTTQIKLLRVLQEREFERVGGNEPIRVNVRVITATNRNLEEQIDAKKYAEQNRVAVRRISTPAIDLLMSYHWPGNVRELENCIERAVLLSVDEVIHSHHLPPSLQSAESTNTEFHGTLEESLENLERELILDALKSTRGNMAKAARLLGITERIMGLRVKRHEIDARQFRTRM